MSLKEYNDSFKTPIELVNNRFLDLINLVHNPDSEEFIASLEKQFNIQIIEGTHISDSFKEIPKEHHSHAIGLYYDYLENGFMDILGKVTDIRKRQDAKDKIENLIKGHMTNIFVGLYSKTPSILEKGFVIVTTKESLMENFE